MKHDIKEEIEIPSGIQCEVAARMLKCKKDAHELSREITSTKITVKIEGNKIIFHCPKGNKAQYKIVMSYLKHIANMFRGLEKKFVYKLQAANVHFPMTLKVVGEHLEINNFLGEKVPRKARILPHVTVEIKGQEITVSSHDKESAGHTVSNIEKATRIKNRDRRIFQDGIYLVSRPEGNR